MSVNPEGKITREEGVSTSLELILSFLILPSHFACSLIIAQGLNIYSFFVFLKYS